MRDLSTLSKLLAEEDIHVVYRNQSTAAFDVKNRELSLPIWKDMSDVVQELMTCHEVGHALWTPLEMLEKVKEEKINFSFVNVLEDVRIEKLVQTKYPGSVRIFNKGYEELINGNFFETVGKDISKYNLIDRINLHYKHYVDVPFSDEEKVWVQKANQTKTPQDVLDLAKELYKYVSENEESQGENQEQENASDTNGNNQVDTVPSPSGGQEKDTEGQNTQSEKTDDSESKDEKNDTGTSNSNDKKDSDEKTDTNVEVTAENQSEGSTDEKSNDTKIVAVTDEVSKKSMEKYMDKNATEYEYAFIPKINLSKTIVSTKEILDTYQKKYLEEKKYDSKYWYKTLEEVNTLKKDSKKTVAYMVKEFEMKKAADLYARASTSKTGSLDMSKLHTYKFNDDIFSKVTRMPGATNHGLVMFLDWSGSMAGNLKGTLNQLFQLIWFCNKVKIPFEVYAFTNGWLRKSDTPYEVTDNKPGTICTQVSLLNIFSSNNKTNVQDDMMHYLYMHGSRWTYRDWRQDGYPYNAPKCLELCSTPLNDTIIVAMDLLPDYQKKTGIQKLHTVFLTDGASDSLRGVHHIHTDENGDPKVGIKHLSSYKQTNIFTDTKTNTTVKSSDYDGTRRNKVTEMLLDLLRKRVPNMNIVNFFIAGSGRGGNIRSETLYSLGDDLDGLGYYEMKQLVKQINKDRFYIIENGQGFDNLYLLPGLGSIDMNEELDLEDGVVYNKSQLKRAFSKFAGSKVTNRPLLNNFVKMVA